MGSLAPSGTAAASLVLPPGLAAPLAGSTVTVAAAPFHPLVIRASENAASVAFTP